jgi:nicotinamide-nucleotide amidase
MKNPVISILVIGDELLCGKTLDSNSHFISQVLCKKGYAVHSVTIVGDNEGDIIDALKRFSQKSDFLIISGGLGPTSDDITRFAVAKAINKPLRVYPREIKRIQSRLLSPLPRIRKMSEIEAHMPCTSVPLRNRIGTAPGFRVFSEGCVLFCIPGVPQEARSMLLNSVLPYIEKKSSPAHSYHYLIKTIGIGESAIQDKIASLIVTGMTVGFYPKGREVDVWLHGHSLGKRQFDGACRKIQFVLKDFVYAHKDVSIADVVGSLLREKKMTLALAESCTGGLLSQRLTDIPGASEFFLGSLVAYSNNVKSALLGVREKTLGSYGAVSRAVARQMARGVREKLGSDISLSITGIAGPSGGSDKKPVGLVFIALHSRRKTIVKKFIFRGDREKVRWLASQAALQLMWSYLRS